MFFIEVLGIDFRGIRVNLILLSCSPIANCLNKSFVFVTINGTFYVCCKRCKFFETFQSWFNWLTSQLDAIESEMFRRQKISSNNNAKEFYQTQANSIDTSASSRGSTSPSPLTITYKDQKSVAERKQEVATIRAKFPNKIPVNN